MRSGIRVVRRSAAFVAARILQLVAEFRITIRGTVFAVRLVLGRILLAVPNCYLVIPEDVFPNKPEQNVWLTRGIPH